MRLIDVDAMNEELFYEEMGGKDTLITCETVFEMIKAQPIVFNCNEVIDKLGHYENLEEQGLLLRLPCKVGDLDIQKAYNKAIDDFVNECICYEHLTFEQEHIERIQAIAEQLKEGASIGTDNK